ncbi:hypothetical protein AVEN_201517-1 [Araneus ventricosus]|uniref:Uncharacterized protein n=1 Tax=Araneus ventricosus TaxID=182803 RepID=A0A4Y2Q604_ARAVE|nr:hypothetical protein AVEN_201517-1 [Araneus ventricosus]
MGKRLESTSGHLIPIHIHSKLIRSDLGTLGSDRRLPLRQILEGFVSYQISARSDPRSSRNEDATWRSGNGGAVGFRAWNPEAGKPKPCHWATAAPVIFVNS